MGRKSRDRRNRRREEKARRREVVRQHRWRLGQDPRDPDTGNPNVEFVNLGRMIEEDEKQAPRFPLWTPGGGPESGMPCPECGAMTRIVASKTVQEMLEPLGWKPEEGSEPPRERVVALACPRQGRVVVQMRESLLPGRFRP